ncbi:PepSY domain-containing protein [Salinimonas marina]|uniref:PepSY domain-containing protein n=1 Tax=Salinimonas marina TaxID=2785918 RepID=A0A7S9DZ10_9ALTE|nr:PepSY domain-containing protein [Salinimonas marina]QPG06437.1 PepSY domain-containing protein [Salinimonas marina]
MVPPAGAGGRRFWLDIHRVTGMWISILALFLLVSGLPWTTVWGSGFQAARSYFAQMQVEQDWSTAPDTKTAPAKNTKSEPELNLSPAIYRVAVDAALSPPVALSPSTLQPGAWRISSMDPNLPARASVWVDANAAVLKRSEFADNPALDKVILTGIAAHEGQLSGLANQLLGLLAALGLMLLSISGFVMWYKRKPGRQLGAPKSRFYDKRIVALVTGLTLLLPMVLFSILSLLVTEWLILRRVERLRRFFALSERKT